MNPAVLDESDDCDGLSESEGCLDICTSNKTGRIEFSSDDPRASKKVKSLIDEDKCSTKVTNGEIVSLLAPITSPVDCYIQLHF